MSLYAQYLAERTGTSIVETPHGFATYRIVDDGKGCYIEDLFVEEAHRRTGLASSMADTIAETARAVGATYLVGSIVPSANGSTASLKGLLAYGFRLASCTENFILLRKDL